MSLFNSALLLCCFDFGLSLSRRIKKFTFFSFFKDDNGETKQRGSVMESKSGSALKRHGKRPFILFIENWLCSGISGGESQIERGNSLT